MGQRQPLQYVTARWGDKYGPEYVTALKNQVPGLVCLGDDRPLLSNYEYWWCILEPFAPWNADLRPALWIDLDTYIFDARPFDNLDPFHFWMIRDFNRPDEGECGLMLVPDSPISDLIWTSRPEKPIPRSPAGAYLRQFPHRYIQDRIDGIYSYKKHCIDQLPADAVACCFHGRPKPPETKGWSHNHWSTCLTKKFSPR